MDFLRKGPSQGFLRNDFGNLSSQFCAFLHRPAVETLNGVVVACSLPPTKMSKEEICLSAANLNICLDSVGIETGSFLFLLAS